jgi:hypothetical protein
MLIVKVIFLDKLARVAAPVKLTVVNDLGVVFSYNGEDILYLPRLLSEEHSQALNFKNLKKVLKDKVHLIREAKKAT